MPASRVLLLSFEDNPPSPLNIHHSTAIHHAFGFFSQLNVMVRFSTAHTAHSILHSLFTYFLPAVSIDILHIGRAVFHHQGFSTVFLGLLLSILHLQSFPASSALYVELPFLSVNFHQTRVGIFFFF